MNRPGPTRPDPRKTSHFLTLYNSKFIEDNSFGFSQKAWTPFKFVVSSFDPFLSVGLVMVVNLVNIDFLYVFNTFLLITRKLFRFSEFS